MRTKKKSRNRFLPSMSSTGCLSAMPTELLTIIFSYLPYWDIKFRLPQVNSQFAAMLSNLTYGKGDFHRAIYREIPASTTFPKDHNPEQEQEQVEYDYHPAFDILHYVCLKTLKEAEFRYPASIGTPKRKRIMIQTRVFNDREKVISSPIRHENAVIPATTHLILHTNGHYPRRREVMGTGAGGAVTVLDVLNTLDKAFSFQEVHAYMRVNMGYWIVPLIPSHIEERLKGIQYNFMEVLETEEGVPQLSVYISY